jgi:sugar lactone lactonase YvrE
MTSISHDTHLPLDATPRQSRGTDGRVSTLQPFVPGDVFVGATQLNSPTDDHAGLGRIIQFDAKLNEKGVLWVEGTTHLIYGLNFAPDGTLWAQDPWAWTTVRVEPSGRQLPNLQFDMRAFSKVHFMADGTLLFTESLDGDHQPEPLTTRHRPLPGHRTHLGDGDLWRYTPDGELVEVCEPEVHGGMSGSMGVTHSVLSPDESRLLYVSETGPRLMQFDLANGRQLTDLRRGTEGDRTMMHFDLSLTPDGTLMVCMGNRVDALTQDGVWLRTYRLPGFGWSIIDARCGTHAYVGNWFSGELLKLDLQSGEVVAQTIVAEKCMAGVAQYLPSGSTTATEGQHP